VPEKGKRPRGKRVGREENSLKWGAAVEEATRRDVRADRGKGWGGKKGISYFGREIPLSANAAAHTEIVKREVTSSTLQPKAGLQKKPGKRY